MNKDLREKIENCQRRYGKSTLVTNAFLAGCKANKDVEYRHPDFVAMSYKRYKSLSKSELYSHLLKKLPKHKVNKKGFAKSPSDAIFNHDLSEIKQILRRELLGK